MAEKLVITIDGPAGAGKSTVSKALAAKLCYIYLDTGAFYRAFAYKAKKEGILQDDDEGLSRMGGNISIRMLHKDGRLSVFVGGEEVTDKIRTQEISLLASTISARPCVRQALLSLQREAGAKGGIVAEGRDMGTVVFPGADYKFYLDATVAERAKRRYREVLVCNDKIDYEQIEKDIVVRDKQDKERAIAPLKPAETAVIIDSTDMTVDEVVDKIIELIFRQNP